MFPVGKSCLIWETLCKCSYYSLGIYYLDFTDFFETASLAGAKMPSWHCQNYPAQCLTYHQHTRIFVNYIGPPS